MWQEIDKSLWGSGMTYEQLLSFIDNTSDVVSVVDRSGRVLLINQAAERMFGISREEFITDRSVIVPDEALMEESRDYVGLMEETGQAVEFETVRRHKDGTIFPVVMIYTPVRDPDGKIIATAGTLKDITEIKRIENALRESEAKYRLIAENMSDLLTVIDEQFEIIYGSPSHLQVLGLDSSHFIGRLGLDVIHPDDRPHAAAKFGEMLETKRGIEVEYRCQHALGHWVHLEGHGTPVYHEDGSLDRIIIVTRDISERKRTEELLVKTEKLSIVGELAAGLAHEIRNPLTSLKGFLQLMIGNGRENLHYLNVMMSELNRIEVILSELLVLAKPQALNFRSLDIAPALQEVVTLTTSEALLKSIEIDCRIEPNLPPISGDANQLKQVCINFIKNGIEAMAHGGTIVVQACLADDGLLLIRFTDQGCGISQELLPKLGEPFYTTKEKGTGLGLMVSKKIIENHRGHLMIDSATGVGTIIEVRLPCL